MLSTRRSSSRPIRRRDEQADGGGEHAEDEPVDEFGSEGGARTWLNDFGALRPDERWWRGSDNGPLGMHEVTALFDAVADRRGHPGARQYRGIRFSMRMTSTEAV